MQNLRLGISFFAGLAYANLLVRQDTQDHYAPCDTVTACVAVWQAGDDCAASDNSCFCPTALAFGPECSVCFATVDTSMASDFAFYVSSCRQEGFSAGATTLPSVLATADTAATPADTKPAAGAGSTKAPSTTKSTSAASYGVFGASTIFGVSLIVLAASVLTLFG